MVQYFGDRRINAMLQLLLICLSSLLIVNHDVGCRTCMSEIMSTLIRTCNEGPQYC